MRTKVYLIAGLVILAVVLVLNFMPTNLSLEAQAANIIAECRSEQMVNNCYDQKVEGLTGQLAMEQSFDLVKLIQQQDDGYWFCHTVSHSIGSREYDKNPGDWTAVLSRCPIGICSNGCLHGVIQEHFGSEFVSGSQIDEIVDAISGVCKDQSGWNAAQLQTASCYHELGHVAFLTTGGQVLAATSICDRVSTPTPAENYLQTCYEGVTMSVFQPLEPDDFAIVFDHVPKKEQLKDCESLEGEKKSICWRMGWKGSTASYCGKFAGELKYACFREAWIMEGESLESASGIENYCAYAGADQAEKKKCYNKIFYGLVARFEFDESKMIALCLTLPPSIKGQCFANTASRLIETDRNLVPRAVNVCVRSIDSTSGSECFNELLWYSRFAFNAESSEFFDLCSRLPEEWKQKCFAKDN